MRKWLPAVLLLALLVVWMLPTASFTEDRDTVLLAKTIYALGRDESYAGKLAIGTVVMNRVENPWFAGTLGEVLREQHAFPSGSRYDDESLRAAHAVLTGKRTLNADAVYYQALDASDQWDEENRVAVVGNYGYYSVSGNN